ncbi:MAG: OmpH family outer membrane protein [Thermoguttaceae bacterium]|nr:OmpH family outer membrane protein [Thermoguttaceae bacterium]MDW8077256.1 OmpH family outer membrane protein [Thermoguttaceae bacterium]
MKQSHLLASVLLGCVLIGAAMLALAQGPAASRPVAQPAGPFIAMVDVGYIFKNHVRFKQMMDSLKAEIQQADARVRAENDAIRQMMQQLEQERPGTPNYKQLEEAIAKKRADLQVQMGLQRKEFVLREAKLYHSVYQEIEQVVRYYATQNNIAVVLRFNGEPADPDDPDSILREINKPVVYFAPTLDLTPVVLEALNRSAAQTATPRQPAVSTRPGMTQPY